MSAPKYVPRPVIDRTRTYRSAPRRLGAWRADRPGEIVGRQPVGDRFAYQGPDQGYALTLMEKLAPELHLAGGEHAADAHGGAVAVALKRASMFGRAPTMDDVVIGATVWGFLDATPDSKLVDRRRPLFAEAGHPHHEAARRAIAAAVPESTLRRSASDVTDAYTGDWTSLLAD